MKYLIAGLGNIGEEYKNTRHNIGFKVLNQLAKEAGIYFSETKYAYSSNYKFKGRHYLLIKPTTLMNLSGKAINYWLQKEKIPINKLLIITDDIALPFGHLRLRGEGSDGGHNGLRDIINSLQTSTFARLRFGIDNDYFQGSQSDYVLSEFNDKQKELIPKRIEQCIKILKHFGTIGLDRTMSEFNNK